MSQPDCIMNTAAQLILSVAVHHRH